MLAEKRTMICPICRVTTKSNGNEFTSLWSVTLHVAGKAKTVNDLHRAWVYKLVPGIDIKSVSNNKLGDQIQFYVQEALEQLEDNKEPDEDDLGDFLDSCNINLPISRSEHEHYQYITAYQLIWSIETRLHWFVANLLSQKEGQWWKAFPPDLQKKCLDRALQDNHRSPLECYIDLLDFGVIIKHNRDVFSYAFDRVAQDYKDPRAEFHSKLNSINALRNFVMHPVRQVTPSDDDLAMLKPIFRYP